MKIKLFIMCIKYPPCTVVLFCYILQLLYGTNSLVYIFPAHFPQKVSVPENKSPDQCESRSATSLEETGF